MRQRLDGRVALITGASRGIGRAVARRFSTEGAVVIAIARNASALETLDNEIRSTGKHIIFVLQDLTDYTKIDEIAMAVYQRFGRLDILVGNAATLGSLSPVPHITPSIWDQVIALNVTANFNLIRSFDPLLRQSDAGRAVFVTSEITRNICQYWGAYAASKAALEMLVKIYAQEVHKTRIRVNLLDPGTIQTDLYTQAFPGAKLSCLPIPESVTNIFVDLVSPEWYQNGQIIRTYS